MAMVWLGAANSPAPAPITANRQASAAAAYLHFPGRGDLLVALFDHVNQIEDLAGSVRPVWEAPDPVTALQEWARHVARFHPRILPVASAINRVRRIDVDAAAHWQVVMRDQLGGCRRLIDWLHQEGRLAPPWTPASAADMLWALMSLGVLEELTLDRGWSTRRYGEHLAAVFQATFVRPPLG